MSKRQYTSSEYLQPATSEAQARKLFSQAVNMVEIEVFSYCNRVCWFCPNTDGSRLGENRFMAEELYESVMAQLASIGYRQTISYSRYNEPLANSIILDRIRRARSYLPEARLHTNTNGDYLNRAYLELLRDAGLNTLNIQVYLKNNERYDHEKCRKKAATMMRKLGLEGELVVDIEGRRIEYLQPVEGMRVRLYARNFDFDGANRGGTVSIADDYVRTAPCLEPYHKVFIDHDGSMMPCCNLRSDTPEHQPMVVKKLTPADDLFGIYAGARLAGWRRSLVSSGEKRGVCASCRFGLVKREPKVITHGTAWQAVRNAGSGIRSIFARSA